MGAKNGSALRYAGLTQCKDYRGQIQLIKDGGYATDVQYVKKVCDIIDMYGLDKHDKGVANKKEIEDVLDKIEQKTTIDKSYWRRVLAGELPATSDYLLTLFKRLAV